MDQLPPALAPFATYSQFIVYVLEPDPARPGKSNKLPRHFITNRLGDAHDPAMWTTFEEASAAAKRLGPSHGVGFVFTDNDPFWFLDVDNAWNVATQSWSPVSQEIYGALQGAAFEISSSKTGFHLFGSGRPPIQQGCRNPSLGIELYYSKRFVALTGLQMTGSAHFQPSPEVFQHLVTRFFPTTTPVLPFDWSDGPVPEWRGPTDDGLLIERACLSKSAGSIFGNNARFVDLWEANADVLAEAFPHPTKAYDESSADAALACQLAFWTGKDCPRILRLMNSSQLAREKWSRADYLTRTILGACGATKNVLKDRIEVLPGNADGSVGSGVETTQALQPSPVTSETFLNAEQQLSFFRGCVYVIQDHKIFTPFGLLKPEQFRAIYGGYTFQMDNRNEKVSKNAAEAFLESQAIRSPRVHGTCFKPRLVTGGLLDIEGKTYVNVYKAPTIRLAEGPTDLFDLHLRKLFPDNRDRLIVFYYLCALVQYQGVKFAWCVFIQGVEGNGKTFLSQCVAYCVGREYAAFPKSHEMTSKFNGWISTSIFAAIEDAFTQSDEFTEIIKPMVTSARYEVEEKGRDKATKDICVNFLINSNHKNGINKSENDRRIAPFFTAQQEASDLKRDGMTGEYFNTLFSWANGDGFAAIGHLLMTTPIPDEFNPTTGCTRAPITSCTQESIGVNRSYIEDAIQEAVESNMVGFRGGWISSYHLSLLLEKNRWSKRMPVNQRKDLLFRLGYAIHPGLASGRATCNLPVDGNIRPILYVIKRHHTLERDMSASELTQLYVTEQSG